MATTDCFLCCICCTSGLQVALDRSNFTYIQQRSSQFPPSWPTRLLVIYLLSINQLKSRQTIKSKKASKILPAFIIPNIQPNHSLPSLLRFHSFNLILFPLRAEVNDCLLRIYYNSKSSAVQQPMKPQKIVQPADRNNTNNTKLAHSAAMSPLRHLKTNNQFEIHSVSSQLKSSPPSTSQPNNSAIRRHSGQLRQLVDNCQDYGEVIRLAYLANHQEVHIDQETLYFLQKYSTFQIAFIAFVGEKQTGKSFLIDSLLNLTCASGTQQFSTLAGENREEGIYLWTMPFTTNYKRKIFLIQCSGISFEAQGLDRQGQILLDLLNIISSSLVFLHPQESKRKRKNPIFDKDISPSPLQLNILQEIKSSRQRITRQSEGSGKSDSYWPSVVYSLYFAKIPLSISQLYEEHYTHCSAVKLPQPFLYEEVKSDEYASALNNAMAGMNPVFLQKISETMVEVINKTSTKQYQNLKYTGNICCKLLINSIKYLNKRPKIKINKIFASILKQLYQSSYDYHTDLYDDSLKEYFSKEEPFPYDELLQAFKLSSTYAIESFNQVIIQENFHNEYESKLLDYIESKEELIIQINSKKTKNTLKEHIKQVENVKIYDIDSIRSFITSLSHVDAHLDQNRTQIMAEKLFKYTKNIEKRILQDKQRFERERIAELKIKVNQQQQKLQYLIEKNNERKILNEENEKKYRKEVRTHANQQAALKTFKKQIEAEKKFQKQYMVSKQSKKQYAESLLEIVREHEELIRENKKQMNQICKEYEYHPTILQLQKKLEDKEREMKELEKLQSRIDLSRNSVLNSQIHSKNSVIRSAIQKPKETKPGKPIKKLTVKK